MIEAKNHIDQNFPEGKLETARESLGTITVYPEDKSPHVQKKAQFLQRIDPAEFLVALKNLPFFKDIDDYQATQLFRGAWTKMNESCQNTSFYGEGSLLRVLADATSHLIYFLNSHVFHANPADTSPFGDEIFKEKNNLKNIAEYKSKIVPILALFNKALAARSFASDDEASLSGSSDEIKYPFSSRPEQPTGSVFVGLTRMIEENEASSMHHWREDSGTIKRLTMLQERFESIKGDKQKDQLKIILPSWNDRKKNTSYIWHADDFIGTTLDLIEDQITYIERNGEVMQEKVRSDKEEAANKIKNDAEQEIQGKFETMFQDYEKVSQGVLKARIDLSQENNRIKLLEDFLKNAKDFITQAVNNISGFKLGFFTKRDTYLESLDKELNQIKSLINTEEEDIKNADPLLDQETVDIRKEIEIPKERGVDCNQKKEMLKSKTEMQIKELRGLEDILTNRTSKLENLEGKATGIKNKIEEWSGSIKQIDRDKSLKAIHAQVLAVNKKLK